MAGSLVISEDAVWRPAGWVFDQTLDALASKLEAADPELAHVLVSYRRSVTLGDPGGLELRQWDRPGLALLAHAVDELYARVRVAGPDAVFDRRFYAGLKDQLGELRVMLHAELAARRPDVASAPWSCSIL